MRTQKGFKHQISNKEVKVLADELVTAIVTTAVVTEDCSTHILNILYQRNNLNFKIEQISLIIKLDLYFRLT